MCAVLSANGYAYAGLNAGAVSLLQMSCPRSEIGGDQRITRRVKRTVQLKSSPVKSDIPSCTDIMVAT